MSDQGQDGPKIIVDSDWKSQAQAERDRLAQEETARKPAASPGAGAGTGAGPMGEGAPGAMPPADFRTLVESLAVQALMYLGGVADRRTGQAIFDPDYSRHMIDLLGVLEEKTRGNLSAEESQELGTVLQELRLRYVELARMMAEQMASAPPGAGLGTGPGLMST